MIQVLHRSAHATFVLSAILLAGCATRASLHNVVLDYDETVSRAQAEMLLLNIARARHQRPVHFTTVSGIAATFDYRTSASIGGEIAENPGVSILTPSIGVSVSENPTISIVPIQGEEFTRRLLTPLDESVFGFFYHQGVDPALLLRLCAHGAILERDGVRNVHPNDSLADDLGEFGRVVSRVRQLRRGQALDVGPLVFEETWPLEESPVPSATDFAQLIENGYDVRHRDEKRVLVRRVVGRQAITNYDPATLSNSERQELHRRAQQYPSYFVLLDIRAPADGAQPLRGWIKLRSMSGILDSIAAGVRRPDEPAANSALRVTESVEPVDESLFDIPYEGLHYSVPREVHKRNQTAFRALYRLYQMTVSKPPGAGVPPVTIAK